MAGAAYGRVTSLWRYTRTFHPSPETPTLLELESGASKTVVHAGFEPGSVLHVCSQRAAEGEAAADDLFLVLPQARAFRVVQYRRQLEALAIAQVDGPLLHLPWEVDHPKEPGGRWEDSRTLGDRRPVSQGRRAIEEFGVMEASGEDAGGPSGRFTSASREAFERPLRPEAKAAFAITAAGNDSCDATSANEAYAVKKAHSFIIDEQELLSGEMHARKLSNGEQLGAILVEPDTRDPDGGAPNFTTSSQGPSADPQSAAEGNLDFGRKKRCKLQRKRQTDSTSASNETTTDACESLHRPWGEYASREEWAVAVESRNEKLMQRWRCKSKQRVGP